MKRIHGRHSLQEATCIGIITAMQERHAILWWQWQDALQQWQVYVLLQKGLMPQICSGDTCSNVQFVSL